MINQPLQPQTLGDYFMPTQEEAYSPLVYTDVGMDHFELEPEMIQWVQATCSFHGLSSEDPYDHLSSFQRICGTFKVRGLTQDETKFILFPFTLQDAAQYWLNTLPNNSIATWSDLKQTFLNKYFPPSRVAYLRYGIVTFQQCETENVYEAWERFKEMLRKCPGHKIEDYMQLGIFYNGLMQNSREFLDISSGGDFMMQTIEEARKLLDAISQNYFDWQGYPRMFPKEAELFEIETYPPEQVRFDFTFEQLEDSSKLKGDVCEFCSGNHKAATCPTIMERLPFLRLENQGNGANCNNFDNQWGEQSSNPWNIEPQGEYQRLQTPEFQNQQQLWTSSKEEWGAEQTIMRSVSENLETTDGMLVQSEKAQSEKSLGIVPSDTKLNFKSNDSEQVEAFQTSSEKILPDSQNPGNPLHTEAELTPPEKQAELHREKEEMVPGVQTSVDASLTQMSSLPLPRRNPIKNAFDPIMSKFIQSCYNIDVNILLVDAFKMPRSCEHFKESVSERPRLNNASFINEESSAARILKAGRVYMRKLGRWARYKFFRFRKIKSLLASLPALDDLEQCVRALSPEDFS